MTDYQTYVLKGDIDSHATSGFLPCSAMWPTYQIGKDRYAHISAWSNQWDKARELGFVAPPSTYARLAMQDSPDTERVGLRPQWRVANHLAWTPGPMNVYHRGACKVVGIDIKGAFLTGMSKPLPIRDSWRTIEMKPANLERYAAKDTWGIVDCTVTVPDNPTPGLPARDVSGNTVYPIGTFRYCFPTDILLFNVQYKGVVIEAIHGAQVCDTEPWLKRASETMYAMPKFAKKHLYTRAYGLWGSIGGYRGTPQTNHRSVKIAHSCLQWVDETMTLNGGAGPMYRPDVSCRIAAHSTMRMLTVMRELEQNDYPIVATHVDCIWYRDDSIRGLPRRTDLYCPDDFAVKHSGFGTFIRPGLYAVDDSAGRCGVSSGTSAKEIHDMPCGIIPGREWRGLFTVASQANVAGYGLPVAWNGTWQRDGWYRGDKEIAETSLCVL